MSTLSALAAVVVLTLSACGGSTAPSSGKAVPGDTLTIASSTPPISLNPALNGNGVPLMWFAALAYEPLIVRNPDNTTSPGLATSWKYSDGNKTFTLELRPGVKFSDGSDLTAEAVVKFIQYYQKSGTFAFNLASLASVTATGPLEVTFHLSSPDPLYPYYLDEEGAVGNIPSEAATENPAEMATATFGAGPYMLDTAATVPNSSYVYTANPTFFDRAHVHWKKIIIKIIADDNAALAALRSGQIQAALGDATDADAAKAAGLNVTSEVGGMTGVVIADRDGKIVPALKDLRVRQALNYAIDRVGLTRAVYRSYGSPTMQYKPAGTDGYVAAMDSAYPYNVTKAKQLLAEAGYPNGFTIQLIVQPGVPGGTLLAQAMSQEWEQIGVHAPLTAPATFSDYVAKVLGGGYGVTTYVYDYQPFIWELNELFSPTGVYNFLGAKTPALDALRAQINSSDLGSPAANALEQQAMTYAVQNALSVPVSAANFIVFSAKNIGGVAFTPSFPIPDPTQWYLTA
ncbi:MAG TPA: ABC transporter substrate-binding protein [Ktedonobacterales bacterium]|nr:ABC transporter substrate-binding protein [Ktedonobacterales bacterium]